MPVRTRRKCLPGSAIPRMPSPPCVPSTWCERVIRRSFLASGLVAVGIREASAADIYPSKPVKWVVPYPAGAFTDAAARVIGQRLAARLGQQFVIDNKTG